MDNHKQPESSVSNRLGLVVCSNDCTCSSSNTPLVFQSTRITTSELAINRENLQGNGEGKDLETYFDSFPKGFRFKPLDEELVEFYLKKKINNQPLPPNQIYEVQLYKYDPKTLAAMYKPKRMDELYFFTPRIRKYLNGDRPNRAVPNGYWKATTANKEIKSKLSKKKVGSKKSLVFYEGKPPKGTKTNWIMHEYTLIDLPKREKASQTDMKLDDWVLCKIRKNVSNTKRSEKAESESNQDIETEINPLLNPTAAVAEASGSNQGGNNLTPEPLHVPQLVQQLPIFMAPQGNLLQENMFSISSVSEVNTNQMETPFDEEQNISAYAEQMMSIEDLAPLTNDPLLSQTTYKSLDHILYEPFPQCPESEIFDVPVQDPLYPSTKDEKDTEKDIKKD